MNPRVVPAQAHRRDANGGGPSHEQLIVEYPLQLILNGEPFMVTMRTPGDDQVLARGLLFGEGLIDTDEAIEWRSEDRCNGTELHVGLPEQSINADHRAVLSVSSCGLCGKRDLSDIYKKYALDHAVALSPERIASLFQMMQSEQEAFKLTGACHAAAAATEDGQLLAVYEDVGRHNAVDKVIGYLLEAQQLADAAVMLVSGRVSYEILQKTAHANIPVLASVSAPTALSVNFASHWGMTLAAFCRDDRMTVYCGDERIATSEHAS